MPRRGGRRRKARTHVDPEKDLPDGAPGPGVAKIPRSMVVRRGKLGRAAWQLVDDLRNVMQPYTAAKLKERKTNSIKDYVSAAGPLGVTHILAMSQTDLGPTLRIGRLPNGPTLTFKVMRYALASHVRAAQRRPCDPTDSFQTSPLVVLNNFDAADASNGGKGSRHMQIVALTFQAMFPSINVKTVQLSECRRVVLVSFNAEEETVEFRHFLIRTRPQGASRTVKKLMRSKIPNLTRAKDISELLLENSTSWKAASGAGYATSDSEGEDEDAMVTLPREAHLSSAKARRNAKGQTNKSMIRLSEIGPRMTLRLLKIQDGSFGGEVQYHAFINRSEEEQSKLRKKHKDAADLKASRRAHQEENVKRKKDAAEAKEKAKKERRAAREAQRLAEEKAEEEGGTEADTEGDNSDDDVDDEGVDVDEEDDDVDDVDDDQEDLDDEMGLEPLADEGEESLDDEADENEESEDDDDDDDDEEGEVETRAIATKKKRGGVKAASSKAASAGKRRRV